MLFVQSKGFIISKIQYAIVIIPITLLVLSMTGCGADDDNTLQEISSETVTSDGVESTIEQTETPTEQTNEPLPNSTELSDEEIVLSLVNASRAELGLSPLVLDEALNNAAYDHSADMLENDYFDHTGLNGSRFWERAENAAYDGFARAENIAYGQRSPEAVHTAWMNSEGHRKNILLEDITEMGLGRAGNVWTQMFGKD